MASESSIRDALTRLIVRLVELVLRALGFTGKGQVPRSISISGAWSVEIWWELALDEAVKRTQLGPEAEHQLRTALGKLVESLEAVSARGGGAEEIYAETLRFRDRWTGWSRKVAVTESTRLGSEAVLASKQAERPGAYKTWVTSHDDAVRPSHRAVDGERVPVAGVFVVGDGTLRYPGDPLGDPAQVVGCRCHLRIVTGRRG